MNNSLANTKSVAYHLYIDSHLHIATMSNSAIVPPMNSPFFLQSELGRAQAQLAESLANLPALSPIGAETESCNAIAPQRSFANAANLPGFGRALWQGWSNIRSKTC